LRNETTAFPPETVAARITPTACRDAAAGRARHFRARRLESRLQPVPRTPKTSDRLKPGLQTDAALPRFASARRARASRGARGHSRLASPPPNPLTRLQHVPPTATAKGP
jgi:hypothetical protein